MGNNCPCGSEASQDSGGPSKTGASCCSGNILVLGWERPSRGHTVHLSNRNTHWLISTCMAIQAPFNTVKTGTLMECYNTSSLYKKESVSHLGDCSAERGLALTGPPTVCSVLGRAVLLPRLFGVQGRSSPPQPQLVYTVVQNLQCI